MLVERHAFSRKVGKTDIVDERATKPVAALLRRLLSPWRLSSPCFRAPAQATRIGKDYSMKRNTRRKLLVPAPADSGAPLPDQAAAWVDSLRARRQTHLFYPVARLRRKFRIGFGASCALAELLAQRGEWTIRFSGDGTRYARIHLRVPM
jgi:hypothetical protein